MINKSYETLIFDCDGVLLNSNKVKTKAFYDTALPFGEDAAKAMVEYHVNRGGISRYKKFEWFLEQYGSRLSDKKLDDLLTVYANCVLDGLMSCDVVAGLTDLKQVTGSANWLIVSGGDQQELRTVFARRKLDHLFDGGIFGSPDSKDEILARELNNANIRNKAVFIGDSEYDYRAATNANLDFIFVTAWTEFEGWESFFSDRNIPILASVTDLIHHI